MRRIIYIVLALLPLSVAAAVAQAPPAVPATPPQVLFHLASIGTPSPPVPAIGPEAVVERFLSFDRDGNARLEKHELAERMHPVLASVDADRDGALDVAEVRGAAARTRPVKVQSGSDVIPFGGQYGFGDENGFTTRSHIEGVLEDLRLTPERKTQAREVALAELTIIETDALGDFVDAVAPFVQPARLSQIRAMIEGQRGLGNATSALRVQLLVKAQLAANLRDQQGEGAAEASAGLTAALDRLKTRLRLEEQDRRRLASKLARFLSEEERENFQAALARRPIVQRGPVPTAPNVFFNVTVRPADRPQATPITGQVAPAVLRTVLDPDAPGFVIVR